MGNPGLGLYHLFLRLSTFQCPVSHGLPIERSTVSSHVTDTRRSYIHLGCLLQHVLQSLGINSNRVSEPTLDIGLPYTFRRLLFLELTRGFNAISTRAIICVTGRQKVNFFRTLRIQDGCSGITHLEGKGKRATRSHFFFFISPVDCSCSTSLIFHPYHRHSRKLIRKSWVRDHCDPARGACLERYVTADKEDFMQRVQFFSPGLVQELSERQSWHRPWPWLFPYCALSVSPSSDLS